MQAATPTFDSTPNIMLVGLSRDLTERLRNLIPERYACEAVSDHDALLRHIETGGAPVDALVIDAPPEEAVPIAQRVHARDKYIPIIILCPSESCDRIKRTLMFSPFLGSEVTPWSHDDLDVLAASLHDAVSRRRQRLYHHHTLSRAQVRFDKLPLLQPEITHYLDQLLDHAPVGVVTVTPSGTILTLNAYAQTILATSGRSPLGRSLRDYFPPESHARLDTLQANCLQQDQARNCVEVLPFLRADGIGHYLEVTLAPLAYRTGQRGAMIILQDVTNRVNAEREQRKAEAELHLHVLALQRFHEITSSETLTVDERLDRVLALGCQRFKLAIALLSSLKDGSLVVTRTAGDARAYSVRARNCEDLAQAYLAQTALSSDPVIFTKAGQDSDNLHPGYSRQGLEAYVGMRIQIQDQVVGTLCFMGIQPSGRAFSEVDRELLKLMARWISSEWQRDRAESHMKKLSSALEQAVDAVMILDKGRNIEYINRSFESLTGYPKQEIVGQNAATLTCGFDDEGLWDQLLEGRAYRGILVNQKKDGTPYHEQRTISPLRDAHGRITHFISTGHDITELVEAQIQDRRRRAELAHVARLSTLGEMASGLAHELNQPLCAITTYAQTCLRILEAGDCKPEQVRYGLEQVLRQSELSVQIFRRLRHFARKGDLNKRPTCLRSVVQEVCSLVNFDAAQHLVRIHIAVPQKFPEVYADPIQIEQVMLNLIRNGIDAIAESNSDVRSITVSAETDSDKHVVVSVSDTGQGCTPDIAARLFEPFFTTKENGLGMGLGISQSIIEARGGRLWMDHTSKSNGATFCFTVPVMEDASDEIRPH